MELVRIIAADGAGVSFDGAEIQRHAMQDTRVTIIHFLVGRIETGLVEMK